MRCAAPKITMMIAAGRLCSQMAAHRKYSTGNTASGIGTKRVDVQQHQVGLAASLFQRVLSAASGIDRIAAHNIFVSTEKPQGIGV